MECCCDCAVHSFFCFLDVAIRSLAGTGYFAKQEVRMQCCNNKKIVLIMVLYSVLTGCVTGGIPFTSRTHPFASPLEYWQRADTSEDQRVEDSMGCKGDQYGFLVNSQANLEPFMQLDDENIKLAKRRLFYYWENCMLSKGYQYTGPCMTSEFSRSRPACGGDGSYLDKIGY